MFEVHSMTGRVGNVDVRTTADGKEVVNVNLATNPFGQEETTWWEIALWGKLAERFQNMGIDKGALLQVATSSVTARAYTDKEGQPKAILRANASQFVVLSPKKNKDD